MFVVSVGRHTTAGQSENRSVFLSSSHSHWSSTWSWNEIQSNPHIESWLQLGYSLLFRSISFSRAMTIRHLFDRLLILNDVFYNGVASMLLSWLVRGSTCQSRRGKRMKSMGSRSLGPLNFLHIWHDNTGEGGDASWFLKSFVVHDLQTMERFDFICQRWFAVEKDDGLVRIPSGPIHSSSSSISSRSNVSYRSQVPWKWTLSHTYYPNRFNTMSPMVIFGFRSFSDPSLTCSHVCNGALAVSFSSPFPCVWASSITMSLPAAKAKENSDNIGISVGADLHQRATGRFSRRDPSHMYPMRFV